MTSETKRKLANISLGGAAVLAVIGWGVPVSASATIHALDGRWVRDSAFQVYQQGILRKFDRDSLNYAADMRDIRRMLSGLDSSDRCRRGQHDFCR